MIKDNKIKANKILFIFFFFRVLSLWKRETDAVLKAKKKLRLFLGFDTRNNREYLFL